MKLRLLLASVLSLSTVACERTTEPLPVPGPDPVQPAPKPVPDPIPKPEPAKPSPVAIQYVESSDGAVTITFTPTSSASIQYRVTCQSSSGTYTATGNASPITVVGLTNGIRNSCTVTAFDSNSSSDPSMTVVVTPGPPLYKPSMLLLMTPGNGSATAAYSYPLELLVSDRPWYVAVTCSGGGTTLTATSADSVVRSSQQMLAGLSC